MTDPTALQDLKTAHDHDWAIALDSQKVHKLWGEIDAQSKRIAELERMIKTVDENLLEAGMSVDLYFGNDTPGVMADIIMSLRDRITELEAFKKLVNGCGFDVVIEPAILLYPERKVLIRHGTVYVPAKDWKEREK